MPTSTLVLVTNKTIQKQIPKARMTVIVSLYPYGVSIVVLMTGLKDLELRNLLNISLWLRFAWSAGNYFSNRLQSKKYPLIPHKQ